MHTIKKFLQISYYSVKYTTLHRFRAKLSSQLSFRHFSSATQTLECWSCKEKTCANKFFCEICHFIQDPKISIENVNYFELFKQ